MKSQFKRHIQSLNSVFEFATSFIQEHQLDNETAFTLGLILEEIFTNILKYNKEGKSDIGIELLLDDNTLLIHIIDECAHPFDVSATNKYDTSASLENRPIGKLGLHLVKTLADHISYDYQTGYSKLTIKKRLRELHV